MPEASEARAHLAGDEGGAGDVGAVGLEGCGLAAVDGGGDGAEGGGVGEVVWHEGGAVAAAGPGDEDGAAVEGGEGADGAVFREVAVGGPWPGDDVGEEVGEVVCADGVGDAGGGEGGFTLQADVAGGGCVVGGFEPL